MAASTRVLARDSFVSVALNGINITTLIRQQKLFTLKLVVRNCFPFISNRLKNARGLKSIYNHRVPGPEFLLDC